MQLQVLGAVGDSGNGGGGGTSSSGSAYTWSKGQSGYRVTIVDTDFKPVATTVHLVFGSPSSNGMGWGSDYYNNKHIGIGGGQ